MEKSIGRTDCTQPARRRQTSQSADNRVRGGSKAYLAGQRAASIALTSVLYFDTLAEQTSMRRYPTAELRWAESLI